VSDPSPLDRGGATKASRSSRLGASLLDGLIFSLPFAPAYISAVASTLHAAQRMSALTLWTAVLATGALFYVALAVDVVLWIIVAVMVHRNAQSIGKKVCGIKVARSDGSRATLGRIFWLRNVANYAIRFVPVLGPIYGLVDVLMIFGDQRRCCHDYIADTIVIQA
jgi:uncharacterized RDD family membrane protein YckC